MEIQLKDIRAFFTKPIPVNNYFIWIGIFIAWLCIIPNTGYYWDVRSWTNWANATEEFGIGNIYQHSDCNYLPGFIYYLKLFGFFHPDPDALYAKIIYLKIMVMASEITMLCIAFRWLKIALNPFHIIMLLTPFMWYNSGIFAQVDGIYSLLVLLSFLLFFRENKWISLPVFILAIFMKLQAIQFVPVFFLVAVFQLHGRHWIKGISASLALSAALLLPFPIADVWNTAIHSVGHFSKVSVMAFNAWFFLCKTDPIETEDTLKTLFHLTYRNWGFLLFASAVLIIPIVIWFRSGLKNLINKFKEIQISDAILLAIFLNLGFFLFFTQMHERYVHPAIVLGFIYALLTRFWIPWLIAGTAYILNMDFVMKQWFFMPGGNPQPAAFYIAILFCMAWVFYAVRIYRQFLRIIPQYPKG